MVVHDYVTQRGGAERVALDLLRAFPDTRLVTSCWNPSTTYADFASFDIETLWLNKIGAFRRDPRRAFPLLARAFAQHTIHDADVVLCSSSGWAHRVATSAPKIVYCHNPARWLYQPHDYFSNAPHSVRERFLARTQELRTSDISAAKAATAYLVNSSVVAERVRETYGLPSILVPPARGLSPDGPMDPVPGLEPGYLLTISRPRSYKHAEVVINAVASMPDEQLVVVGGEPRASWPRGVVHLRGLSDAELRWLYAHASGLVAMANEDFGLTPIEAQAFGVPAVVLRSGGYLDSTVEGVTGVFVEGVTERGVVAGIQELRSRDWDPDMIRKYGQRFAPEAFTERIRGVVSEVLASASDRAAEGPIASR